MSNERTPRSHVWRGVTRLAAALILCLSVGATVAGPAGASTRCPAYKTWEDWAGGARVHASVSFRASDMCEGRHVKRAYVRLVRHCWPGQNTGRIYTASASSPSDSRTISLHRWIFDSPVWSCRTDTFYGYEFF